MPPRRQVHHSINHYNANAQQHPTFRPPRLTLRNPPYEVRRLGWGYFTIEAEIILKEPYSWIVDTVGTRRPGLELTWTLDFAGRGRQGRVRAKVKEFDDVDTEQAGRVLRARQTLANGPDLDDEDDELDDDYEAAEDDESDEEEESDEDEPSEFIESPPRR